MNIDLDIQLSVGLHRIRKDDIIPQPVNKRPLHCEYRRDQEVTVRGLLRSVERMRHKKDAILRKQVVYKMRPRSYSIVTPSRLCSIRSREFQLSSSSAKGSACPAGALSKFLVSIDETDKFSVRPGSLQSGQIGPECIPVGTAQTDK